MRVRYRGSRRNALATSSGVGDRRDRDRWSNGTDNGADQRNRGALRLADGEPAPEPTGLMTVSSEEIALSYALAYGMGKADTITVRLVDVVGHACELNVPGAPTLATDIALVATGVHTLTGVAEGSVANVVGAAMATMDSSMARRPKEETETTMMRCV